MEPFDARGAIVMEKCALGLHRRISSHRLYTHRRSRMPAVQSHLPSRTWPVGHAGATGLYRRCICRWIAGSQASVESPEGACCLTVGMLLPHLTESIDLVYRGLPNPRFDLEQQRRGGVLAKERPCKRQLALLCFTHARTQLNCPAYMRQRICQTVQRSIEFRPRWGLACFSL